MKHLILFSVFVSSILARDVIQPTTDEMIAAEGYPVEIHYVTTSDGYILKLHRIPGSENGEHNGKVAYLQHGLFCSSSDWIVLGPGRSLGYILADQGYDVWMGNTRGNYYSRYHTTYDPDKDKAFWDFSFHEMGTTDVPTMIDYVLNTTGVDGVYYVGESQGTTVFYVMASEKPEYNPKIKVWTIGRSGKISPRRDFQKN